MCTALSNEPSFVIFLAGLILLNPIAMVMDIHNVDELDTPGTIAIFQPFDHSKAISLVTDFVRKVAKPGRILFCYEDPCGKYENLFDGYRNFHELLLNTAAETDLHVIPDWYAVSETNYVGARQIWGRNPNEAMANCESLSAPNLIVYQEANTELDDKWSKDFKLMAVLDWSEPKNLALFGEGFWSKTEGPPKWFLLSCNKIANTSGVV